MPQRRPAYKLHHDGPGQRATGSAESAPTTLVTALFASFPGGRLENGRIMRPSDGSLPSAALSESGLLTVGPARPQLGPRSDPDRSQLGPRSVQLGPRSVQLGPSSDFAWPQIGPADRARERAADNRPQLGPRSAPTRPQLGNSSDPARPSSAPARSHRLLSE